MNSNQWQDLPKEFQLVLYLVQIYHPQRDKILELFKEKIDLVEVLGVLSFYRVAGIAYYTLLNLEEFSEEINGDFLLALKTIYEAQKVRTKSMNEHIKELSKSMDKAQIKHAFLKGAFLSNVIYPRGCRMSNDIDLLVPAEQVTMCSELLTKMEYIQGFSNANKIRRATRKEIINQRLNFGEIVPFHKCVNEPGVDIVSIDVNFSLDETSINTCDSVNEFLENRMYYRVENNSEVATLSLEYFLVHICMHLYKEATVIDWVQGQRDLSLYKFVDIYVLIFGSRQPINWTKLEKVITKHNLQKGCYYALFYASVLFPSLKTDEFIILLEKIRPSDTKYLNQIIDIKQRRTYTWHVDFLTRLFDVKRFYKYLY